VSFCATTFAAAVAAIAHSANEPLGAVRLANAWCVVVANEDVAYRQLIESPGINLPDGVPVAALVRRRSDNEAEQVRGPALFRAVLDEGRPLALKHFMLGTVDGTLARLCDEIEEAYPGANICGTWAPPFGPITDEFMNTAVAMIRDSGAHVVWVGMGSPKQDFVTSAIAAQLQVTAVGVGAAFDFVAGTAPEAPRWLQRIGMEWFFRLVSQPRRLWRRYLIGNIKFLQIAGRR